MRSAMLVLVAVGCLLGVGIEMGAQPGGKGGGGPGGPPFGKKKSPFDADPRSGVVVPPGQPMRVRWEYHMEAGGAMTEGKLNSLGAEGWELAAIDVPPVGGRTYIFRRPGVGAPKADTKPAVEPGVEKKAEQRSEIRVYALKNANAIELTRLIDEVLRVSKSPVTRVVADPQTNLIVVNGPMEIHSQIIGLIDRLDIPSDHERPKVLKKKGPTLPGERP